MNSISREEKVNIFDLEMVVFDFDGVFTDDLVTVNQDGVESVTCSRRDSLGISRLFSYLLENKLVLPIFVVSTETNPVVSTRCEKMRIESFIGIQNKAEFLLSYSAQTGKSLNRTLYVGNDMNDLGAMKIVSHSFAPANADERVKAQVTKVFETSGGRGFVRDVVEYLVPDLWESCSI